MPCKHIDIRPQEGEERAFLLLSRVELIVKAPHVSSSLTDTFLVSGGAALDFLLLPVELSGTSSTGALHSEEARLPEWVHEVLPEEVLLEWVQEVLLEEVLSVFFSPGATARGASALAAVAATASR